MRFFCTSNKEKEWTFNDQQLPQNIAINGRLQEYIIISNLQLSNDGVYKCITKDYYDMEYVAEGRLVVIRKDHNDSEYTTMGPFIVFGEILYNNSIQVINAKYVYSFNQLRQDCQQSSQAMHGCRDIAKRRLCLIELCYATN